MWNLGPSTGLVAQSRSDTSQDFQESSPTSWLKHMPGTRMAEDEEAVESSELASKSCLWRRYLQMHCGKGFVLSACVGPGTVPGPEDTGCTELYPWELTFY